MGLPKLFKRKTSEGLPKKITPSEDKKLMVRVNDSKLQIHNLRAELFRNLENISLSIPSNDYIMQNQGFVDRNKSIDELINRLEKIPQLSRNYLSAVKAIAQYNKEKDISTGIQSLATGDQLLFDNKEYSNYLKYIEACACFLYDRYNFSCKISGIFDGYEREHRHKVKTPYGTFNQGNRNMESAPQGCNFGDILVEEVGFMIGEGMINVSNRRHCIIIDAGHDHGSLGKGTARVKVLYDDGTVQLEVPWLLQSIPSKRNKQLEE